MKNLQEINLTDSIADAAAGSSDAYAFLYRQTYAYCRSIAAKYLGGSEEEIEAVLQNAYLEIFSQLTENMDTDTFLDLTAQKVRHAAVEERIRINEQEGYYTPTVRFGREKTAEDMRAQDYRRYVNRTARLSGKDAQFKMEDILSQLSGSQRLCIALWLDNLTPVQIARETGMTTDEVKSNIRYANRGIERAVAVYEEQGEDLCGMAALPYLLWLSKNYNIYAMSAQAAEAAGAKAEIPNRLLNELERRKNEKNQGANFAKAAAAGAAVGAAAGAFAGAAVVGAADGTAAGAGSGTAAGAGTESAAEAPAAAVSGPAAAQREAFAGTSAGTSAAQKEAFAEASAGTSAAQREAFAGTSAGVSAGASAAGAGTERAAGAGRETTAGLSAEEIDTSDVVDAFAGMNLFGEAAGGEFDGSEYAMGSGAGENAGGEFGGGSESGSGGSSAGRPAYTEIAGFGYSTEASFDESANSGSVYATGSRAGSDASAGESEYAMGSGSESAGASGGGIGVIGTANAPAEETGSTGFSTDGSEYAMGGGAGSDASTGGNGYALGGGTGSEASANGSGGEYGTGSEYAMGGGESDGAGRSEYTESPGFGENADYSAEDSAEYAAEYAAEDAAADSGSGNARIIRILIAVVCAAVIVIIAALVIGKMNTKDKTADSTEQTQEDASAEQTDGTDSANGGTDSTNSDSDSTDDTNGGSDSTDDTNGGSDSTDDTNGGSDSTDDTNGGSDSTDDTNGGSDSADSTDSGTGTSGDSSLTQGYTPQELVEQINVACGLSYSYVGDAYYSAADENIDGIAGVTGIYLADLDQDGSDEMLLFVSGDAAYDFTLEIQVYEKDENDAWTAAASLQTDADEVKNGGYFERYRNMKFYLLGSYIVMETGSAGYDEADTSFWRLFDTEVTTCFSYSGGTLTENAGAAESLGITCRADLYTGEAQELVSVSSVHVSADSLAQKGYTMTGTASDIWAVSFVNFQALEYDGSYTDSGIAFYYPSYYNNDTESVQFASTAGESITISAKGASAASAEAALFSVVIDISLLDSYHLIDDDTIDDATGFRTTGGGCLLAYSEENAWFYYRGEFADTAAASGGNLELYARYFLMMCDSAEIPYHCTITGASQTYPSM